ncbi:MULTISPECIES: GNAT family N-acetyltransferase [unclassified Mesorhizobium]|uniref:GNAT family N-acetyltransferase n=1 Tax=unclassified Mesorhizobium TaxID=325217 RepID=UPI00112C235E|nr:MULTISPECIES: GNAT family N-acetyltransferase [unclassified Mesorhizobium]MBZ9973831.1 GNAT family N-acetyltransferase [Mesorhizobium sp. BR-1-1-10]TPK10172.1 GNAT family N-acetyltransferase [Mesorhizobium sp. B2-5-7]
MSRSDATDTARANPAGSGLKRAMAHVAAPAVIATARIVTRFTTRGVHIAWFDAWNSTLDQALGFLPAIPGCDRDLYRELTRPTSARKRHALATENGHPTALISLRRRRRYWEPVAYQSLSGVIAPASSPAALARALHALGVEVRVEAGLDKSVVELNPRSYWSPDNYSVNLRGDYEARWSRNHRKNVRRARQRCDEFMRLRIDDETDLEWCCAQWGRMWEGNDAEETVAAEDRLRFWRAFMKRQTAGSPIQFHTLHLLDGDRRTAGVVLMCQDGVVLGQCIVRDPEYDRFWVGVRIMEASIEWAARVGHRQFDLGSGQDYKQSWGEPVAGRYGAIFRPRAVSALYRLGLL